jgi:hypothetical protein
MEHIIKNDLEVNWRNNQLTFVSTTKIDDNIAQVEFESCVVLFVANDTTINNILCKSADEIVTAFNK